MAERFVWGFAVDLDSLFGLVGSGRDASEVLQGVGCVDEITELLEEWAPDDPLTAAQAVQAICAGELDASRAYEYRRALEAVAEAEIRVELTSPTQALDALDEDARDEIHNGLDLLAGWLEHVVASQRTLLLMMDGSQ